MKKLIALLLALVLSIGAVSSVFAEKTEWKYQRDTLTATLRSEPSNLDPHNNQSLPCFVVEEVVFDRLIYMDDDGNFQPMLAEEWEVIDDTTIRFKLRDDVYFHNGEHFTAEDVKYTIARAEVMPGSKTFMSAFDGEGTTVIDDYTIDIKLHYAFAPAYAYLASTRGNIVNKKTVEEMGEEAFGRTPIGSGPYKFDSWVAGDRIEVVANEDYWGGQKGAAKKIIFRIITDQNARAIELETGGVDIATELNANDIPRLKDNDDINLQIVDGRQYYYIRMNRTNMPEVQDIRVRQAMYYALDRQLLADALWGEMAEMSTGIFHHSFPYFTPAYDNEYNPEKAKELLSEAGWDSSIVLHMYLKNDQTLIDLAEACQQMWHLVGIELQIHVVDEATLNVMGANDELQIGIGNDSGSSGDPDQGMWVWNTASQEMLVDAKTGEPLPDSIDVYNAFMKTKTLYDAQERTEAYQVFQKLAWELYVVFPIADIKVAYGLSKEIEYCPLQFGNLPNLSLVTFKD